MKTTIELEVDVEYNFYPGMKGDYMSPDDPPEVELVGVYVKWQNEKGPSISIDILPALDPDTEECIVQDILESGVDDYSDDLAYDTEMERRMDMED